MKKMTVKEFLEAEAWECPNCRKTDMSSELMNDENTAELEMEFHSKSHCNLCGANWINEWKLVGYSHLEVPRKIVIDKV
jgi:hypothetical protein